MTEKEAFFVDGRYVGPDEVNALFNGRFEPGDRQSICLEMIEGHTVVDIGCYGGRFVKEAIARYPQKEILGVDYDEEHIHIARHLFPEIRDRFVRMSVYRLEFPDESVDCVTFQEVIEHLENAAVSIREINRVLKKGGVLVLSTVNPYYWRDLLHFIAGEIKNIFRRKKNRDTKLYDYIYFDNVEWNRHIFSFTPPTLNTLLKVLGFSYITHTYGCEGNRLDRLVIKIFPFFGPTQVIKARKTGKPQEVV